MAWVPAVMGAVAASKRCQSAGQLGDGTVVDTSSPIQIGSATSWLTATAGFESSMALRTR